VPALCHSLPGPAIVVALAGFALVYARDAARRARSRVAVGGDWRSRLRLRLAACVALPAELAVRLAVLAAACGAGYLAVHLAVAASGRMLLPGAPAWSLPLGVVALVAIGLRACYAPGVRTPLRLAVPALAAVLLAVAAVTVADPVGWPLPLLE
jgi:hypothetical protein